MTNPTYIFLIETTAITQSDVNTWKAIAQLGDCLLPKVVTSEIKNIADGKSEGNEATARQFQKWRSQANWQDTDLSATHPDLQPRASQNLSRNAKLMLSIAKTALGVANSNPQKCVVLISDEVLLRDRLVKLACQNLCPIPSAAARQWSRTNQIPISVQNAIKSIQTWSESHQVSSNLPITTPETAVVIQKSHSKLLNVRQIAISLVKFGVTAVFLVTILLLGWRITNPTQFQQFWKKTGLPSLPKLMLEPNPPPKVGK